MPFDRVIAQQTPKDRLMRALAEGRLAHAYLFHGPSGVGAEALSIEVAKGVNCVHGPGEPCQRCNPCRKIGAFQHPDVHLYAPSTSAKSTKAAERTNGEPDGEDEDRGPRGDARAERRQSLIALLADNPYAPLSLHKNDYHSIDDIRELRREASAKPFEGRRKVVILLAADRMTVAASNALLKTLEEPPGELLLLLTTDRLHRLLPTIVSRCQPIRLARLSDEVMAEALTSRFHVDPDRVPLAVRQADGSISHGLASVSDGGIERRTAAATFLDTIQSGTMVDAFESVEQLIAMHKETPILEDMLDALLSYYRDLFILRVTQDDATVQNIDRRDWLADLAGRMPVEQIEAAITTIEETRWAITRNAHPQLALTVLAIRLRAYRGQVSP